MANSGFQKFVKGAFFLLSGVSYLICLATILHLAVFLYQTDQIFQPLSSYSSLPPSDATTDLLVDVSLVAAFVFSHSFFASLSVKRAWKQSSPSKTTPEPNYRDYSVVQRSTFVLVTSVTLELLIAYWRPIRHLIVWRVENVSIEYCILALYILGWLLVLGESWIIDHWELFGLSQVYYYSKGWNEPMKLKPNQSQLLFSHSRHPIVTGLALIFFASPCMTIDRFCLAIGLLAYQLMVHGVNQEDVNYVELKLREGWNRLLNAKPTLAKLQSAQQTPHS